MFTSKGKVKLEEQGFANNIEEKDIHIKNNEGFTPLDLAIQKDSEEIIELLSENMAKKRKVSDSKEEEKMPKRNI